MRLQGKTALVTGGSRGIGRACVAAARGRGRPRGLCSTISNQEAADSLVDDTHARKGREVRAVQADVVDTGRAEASRGRSSWPPGSRSTSWSTRPASFATDCLPR